MRIRIKDTSTTRQRYTDAQLTTLINEAQRDVNNNTWAVSVTTTIALALNTTYYNLPSDFIAITRVTYKYQNLYETTFAQLDNLNQNSTWELQSSPPPPQYYFLNQSWQQIGVYPFISTSPASNPIDNLYIKYYAQPADLVNGTDIPFNSIVRLYPYHTLLEVYSAYRVFLIEGEIDKANLYMQEYVSRLAIMLSDVGKRPNYISSFSGPSNSR